MAKKPIYFKLGKEASTFHDPTSLLNINNKQVVKFDGKLTNAIRTAVSHGHILEVEESEFGKYSTNQAKPIKEREPEKPPVQEKTALPEFKEMVRDDIEKWAKEHLEFEDEESQEAFLENLSSLNKKAEVIKTIKSYYEEN